jgi:acetylornithine deacetylase/succinyl-diaminopimelate desuccinylase-like protein
MENIPVDARRLASQLIALPSYVDERQDERGVVDFLEQLFNRRFPELTSERQPLPNSNRANLIVRGQKKPKLLVVGHIDTVQPKDGWLTDPLHPRVRGERLYGLGAADMKGSLAAFLAALDQLKRGVDMQSLALLLYGDEEYDFKGMRQLITGEAIRNLRPSLTLSLDGVLAVASGCRGLIELRAEVRGKSGHAANPQDGINAITETLTALRSLTDELKGFSDESLGTTTTNVAYLCGGVRQTTNGLVTWQRAGNVIADTAELVFEVRPANKQVTAGFVRRRLKAYLEARGLKLTRADIAHDIAPWPSSLDLHTLTRMKRFYREAAVPFALADQSLSGYVDVQMLADTIPAPTVVIGTGGQNKHGPNENVPLANLAQATELYKAILKGILL